MSQDYCRKGAIFVYAGLLAAGLLAGCGGSYTGERNDTENSSRGEYRSLRFTLFTTKAVFASGETVPFTFTITNDGMQSVSVSTPGGASQPADPIQARVTRDENKVWDKNEGKGGGAVVSYFSIAPGETRRYTFDWNQRTSGEVSGTVPVSAGAYTVQAYPYIGLDGVTDPANQLSVSPLTVTIN